MPIKRDDFELRRGVVHLETANHAELWARKHGANSFEVGLTEDNYQWIFNRDALLEAQNFFSRLIKIIEQN